MLGLMLSNAAARDVYVNNQLGDDRWDGSQAVKSGAVGGPVRSINRALQLARRGDRVLLEKTVEPYREMLTLQAGRHSGFPETPFQLIGNGAILDGTKPVPEDAWEHHAGDVFRFAPDLKSFQILYLHGRPVSRRNVTPEGGLPDLRPLEWCHFEREIYFRVEEGRLPRQYSLMHTAMPVGITLYDTRHVIVSDLIVQGFQQDGVNAHDGVFDTTLVGLTCRGNGRSGISVGGASRVRIVASLVGDNGTAQVRTEGFSETRIVNSNLLENSAPAVVQEGGRVLRSEEE
jgi:hypothetical protein